MNSQTQRAQKILACLGDVSRFRVMSELTAAPCCVTDLARRIGLSQSCTTRHLQSLERSGLVRRTRSGKRVFFTPVADPQVRELLAWALSGEPARAPRSGAIERGREPVRQPRGVPPAAAASSDDGETRVRLPGTSDLEDFLL
jgi:DNA-binding transcriptional ArsR family regulator